MRAAYLGGDEDDPAGGGGGGGGGGMDVDVVTQLRGRPGDPYRSGPRWGASRPLVTEGS